ncbi:MAG: PDZ domain-containing protein [Bdellovibrionota bacterium]
MKILIALSSLLFLASCASPTGYTLKDEDGFGYYILPPKTGDIYSLSVFEGNAKTESTDALHYCYIAASEHCHKENKIAIVGLPQNYSTQSTYNQVNSYTVKGVTNVYSTPVTTRFPKFAASFVCLPSVRILDGISRTSNLSREALAGASKDFRGGVMVEEIKKDKPTVFKKNDVILSLDGKRVETESQLTLAEAEAEALEVVVELLRNKKPMKVKSMLIDTSDSHRRIDQSVLQGICTKMWPSKRPAYCKDFVVAK